MSDAGRSRLSPFAQPSPEVAFGSPDLALPMAPGVPSFDLDAPRRADTAPEPRAKRGVAFGIQQMVHTGSHQLQDQVTSCWGPLSVPISGCFGFIAVVAR